MQADSETVHSSHTELIRHATRQPGDDGKRLWWPCGDGNHEPEHLVPTCVPSIKPAIGVTHTTPRAGIGYAPDRFSTRYPRISPSPGSNGGSQSTRADDMLRAVATGRDGWRGRLGSCGMKPVASMWYNGVPIQHMPVAHGVGRTALDTAMDACVGRGCAHRFPPRLAIR